MVLKTLTAVSFSYPTQFLSFFWCLMHGFSRFLLYLALFCPLVLTSLLSRYIFLPFVFLLVFCYLLEYFIYGECFFFEIIKCIFVIFAVLGLSCFRSILDCIGFLLDVIFGNVQFTAIIMSDFLLELTRN
jgi:hypothetical protein